MKHGRACTWQCRHALVSPGTWYQSKTVVLKLWLRTHCYGLNIVQWLQRQDRTPQRCWGCKLACKKSRTWMDNTVPPAVLVSAQKYPPLQSHGLWHRDFREGEVTSPFLKYRFWRSCQSCFWRMTDWKGDISLGGPQVFLPQLQVSIPGQMFYHQCHFSLFRKAGVATTLM